MRTYLGIDTSCYTTSVALVDENFNLLADERVMLDVKQGEKGLRQSEAVFQHVKNSGRIFGEIKRIISGRKIAAVASSTRPRPVQESYMPVFVVAQNIGEIIAGVNNIPCYSTSHQENHIMAGVWSAGGPACRRFLTVHLSGGTTELLEVEEGEKGFDIEIIGNSSDISAGQFVDRIGVEMGLPFPAGVHMEKLALAIGTEERAAVKIPFSIDGMTVSFSGPESHARRMLNRGIGRERVAFAVLRCISAAVARLVDRACRKSGVYDVLFVGGVSSNSCLRDYLRGNLNYRLYFPEGKYCSDNAVGTALMACKADKKQ